MKPDSLSALLNVKLPEGGLPWQILAVLLLLYGAVIVYVVSRAASFKGYAQDFPTQAAPVVVALVLTLMTAPVVLSLIALRIDAPDGTGQWLAFIATMAGVAGVGGLAVKRFSSPEYQQGKATAEAMKAAATPPQPTQVLAAKGSSVNVNTEAEPPAKPVVPRAGDKPDPRLPSPLDDESNDA